jgi:hypothetical protein
MMLVTEQSAHELTPTPAIESMEMTVRLITVEEAALRGAHVARTAKTTPSSPPTKNRMARPTLVVRRLRPRSSSRATKPKTTAYRAR